MINTLDMSILLASLNFGLYFEVDAHAIYVRSLPLNATTTQLEDEFKKFGTIKPDGIQVRSHKVLVFFPFLWTLENYLCYSVSESVVNIF